MTVLVCKKCGGGNFGQENPYYGKDGMLHQVFRCKDCGETKDILAIASGIALSSLRTDMPLPSNMLWDNMIVPYKGKFYRTKLKKRVEHENKVEVELELIPLEGDESHAS